MKEAISVAGLTPDILLMATDTKLSIRQISILTALDRDTVTRRLQGLQSEPGAKNARMYEAPAALRAVLAPALAPLGTLEQIKVRNETLNAQLKELELAKKMQGLIPAQFAFDLIDTFIKFCAGKFDELRRRGVVDRPWISKCEEHWTWLYREFVENYEITARDRTLTSPEVSRKRQDS